MILIRSWQWEIQRRENRTTAPRRRQRGFIINPYAYGVSGPVDPYFANVVALLHFDGANNSTTFTDQTGKTWTRHNSPVISTAQSVFGGASGLFAGGSSLEYITCPNTSDWNFGSGDFTIEGRVRFASTSGSEGLITKENASGYAPFIVYRNSTQMKFYSSSNGTSFDICNALQIGNISANTWYAFAITRSGSDFYTYLDGVAGAHITSSSAVMNTSDLPKIGGYYDTGNVSFGGYLDEVRITKGVARYTGTNGASPVYTPATSAFPDF